MNELKCPICGKPGIEDYRNKSIVCPTCDTDLSVFTILNKKDATRWTFYSSLIGLNIILIVFFVSILLSYNQSNVQLKNQLSAYEINISIAKDSLISLHKQLSQANTITNTVKTKTTEKLYTIKKGDGFCIISAQIYGTQKYGKEIADFNGLGYNNTIYPGKIIRLPLK